MDFRVLGPVEATVAGRPVELGPTARRAVLAILLTEPRRTIPVTRLIDLLWGRRPPDRARANLYSYLSRIRSTLAQSPSATVERASGGYRLTVAPESVDLHRFRDLTRRARAAVDDEDVAALLDRALREWRGEAFTDLDTPGLIPLRAQLADERRTAEREHTDVALRLGRHQELLPRLAEQARAHPLDERLAGQLMLALYRAGRQTEALDHFGRTRSALVDQGIEPGSELGTLHRRILHGDPVLDPPAPKSRPVVAVPRQLPAMPQRFTGREPQLSVLDTAVGSESARRWVVTGTGGVGKTWLALTWAHRNLAAFPDGQLHADLRGFDPETPPRTAESVLRGFLAALDVDPAAIPVDRDDQSALFRSLVADRRMLVVLDNARDTRQVEPLLPGTGCVTIVTSRHELSGLTTAHSARRLPLTGFDATEARASLAAHLGDRRLAAEPEATAALLDHCAGLPLALSIVATRADRHPDFPLSAIAAELAESGMDTLDSGELPHGLRGVFDGSVAALAAPARELFTLWGLAPGEALGRDAVASLAGPPGPAARLWDLESAHLVTQHRPGRYRMHDLTRAYAAEHAAALPSDRGEPARRRLVDHYLYTAWTGERLLMPERTPIELGEPADGITVSRLADRDTALRWFDTEAANLVEIQRLAARHDWHDKVWQLAWSQDMYLNLRGRLDTAVTVWRAAADAAGRIDDPAVRQLTLGCLGQAYGKADRPDEAVDCLTGALALTERTGLRLRHASALLMLGAVHGRRDRHDLAADCRREGLELFREHRVGYGQAMAHTGLAWNLAHLGEFGPAREHALAALELIRGELAGVVSPADALGTLGRIEASSGRPELALEYYRESVAEAATAGAFAEVSVRIDLGDLCHRLGRDTEAAEHWRRAAELLGDQHRLVEQREVTAKLAALSGTDGPSASSESAITD